MRALRGQEPRKHDAADVVLYLMSEKGMTAKAIERFLYNDCGLKGLSGISNDVRELLASSDPSAKLALDYFVYRIALFTGMLAAAMSGIDSFVFYRGHRRERAGHSRGGGRTPLLARPRACF